MMENGGFGSGNPGEEAAKWLRRLKDGPGSGKMNIDSLWQDYRDFFDFSFLRLPGWGVLGWANGFHLKTIPSKRENWGFGTSQ